jgi:FAD/FMN-containing dehydrogenase
MNELSNDILSALKDIVGETGWQAPPDDLTRYTKDWRGIVPGVTSLVVKPANTDEVAAVLAHCNAHGIAVVPQGGHTGMCGAATPDAEGRQIVLSLERMRKIIEIDAAGSTMTVEAGVVLADIQQAAAEAGRLFPLSLGAQGSCQIGGNLSTNAGGVGVLRYGPARSLCLGLEVALADGRIWNGLKKLRKDNTGYDLKQLFIGAEGTLGVITRAVLKLFPPVRQSATAWVAIAGPQAALDLLNAAQVAFGERLTAFEIMPDIAIQPVLQVVPGTRHPLGRAEPWMALIELTGPTPGDDLAEALEAFFGEQLEAGLVSDGALARSEQDRADFWAIREHVAEGEQSYGGSTKHDTSVPVADIPAFIDEASKRVRAYMPEARITAFGHMGDGNIHYNVIRPEDLSFEEFYEHVPEINRIVHDCVAEFGGSMSAEHGLGQIKKAEHARYAPAHELEMQKALKALFDPNGILNPGKLF